jgi:hypothetical protein
MFMAYEPELPAFAASGRHKLRDCDWTGSYHCAVGTAASTIPSPCPDGGDLRTLRDAGDFIAGLPKREHDTFAWRAAIQALMLVAEHGGDTMLPRIGIMRALYPGGMARRRAGSAKEAGEALPDRSMRTARRWWWRRCPVTAPQCAVISKAATDAGRGPLTLLVGGKATVGSTFEGLHTPRIILTRITLSARSSRKPVVEQDHANGKERQSHC